MPSGVSGQIFGMNLESFLQITQMEKTTCTMTVSTRDEVGHLYILQGELIAAETGGLKSKDAAYRILSWENVKIDIRNTCSKKEDEINQPLFDLLLESLRLKDEKATPEPITPSKPLEEPQITPPPDELGLEVVSEEPTQDQIRVPMIDSKDLSKPTEKITRTPFTAEEERVVKREEPLEKVKIPTKKRFSILAVALLAGVLVFVIGAMFHLLLKPGGNKAECKNLLAQLENQPELEAKVNLLQHFLNSRKPDEYTAKVEEKLKEIRMILEDQGFNSIMIKVSDLPIDENYEKEATALYNAYLAQYQEGRYATEIRKKISEISNIMDDADYKKVKAVEKSDWYERILVYKWYLEKHPEGKYRKLISNMGDMYYRYLKKKFNECDQKKEWDLYIKLCSYFFTTFTKHPQLEEVLGLKIKMQSRREFAILMQSAEEKGTDYLAARSIYVEYLRKNSDSIHKDQIEKELARIDKKIQEKEEWEHISAYAEDGKYDVYSRLKKLEQYVHQNPSGSYLKDTKSLMDQLQSEKQATDAQRQKEIEQKKQLARVKAEKDRIKREKERKRQAEQKMMTLLKQAGGRFLSNGDGTVTDSHTGLMWTLLDSNLDLGKYLNYESAISYVSNLQTGGYDDWRLPTVSELARIYKNKPFFPSSGAAWYWSSQAYVDGFHETAIILTSKPENIFKKEYKLQNEFGAVRAVRP